MCRCITECGLDMNQREQQTVSYFLDKWNKKKKWFLLMLSVYVDGCVVRVHVHCINCIGCRCRIVVHRRCITTFFVDLLVLLLHDVVSTLSCLHAYCIVAIYTTKPPVASI